MNEPQVDLVVNCFERSYRTVLASGFFPRIAEQNSWPFALRTALVNNVKSRSDAEVRGQALLEAGEIDRLIFVEDHITSAIARTQVPRDELSWHVDWALVAVTLNGPDWVMHWDADVRLRVPGNWIGPALELMERDRRVLVANPNWEIDNLASFTSEESGAFALGHGFSDQIFLGRRSELGSPVYGQRSIVRWRYPYPDSFEARIDAHLRHAGRLRATHRQTVYEHPVAMGSSWPARSLATRLRAARNHYGIRLLAALPWRPPHLRQL